MENGNGILSWLKKPYPYFYTLVRASQIAILVGLFIGFQDWLLRDILWDRSQFVLPAPFDSIGFGLVTLISVYLIFWFVPKLTISDQLRENWTVNREMWLITSLLATIAVLNLVLLKMLKADTTVFEMLHCSAFTFGIGILPTAIILWINYIIILKQNLESVRLHNENLQKIVSSSREHVTLPLISIPSEIRSEIIDIDVNQLLFIRSDGNYVEVHQKVDSGECSAKVYRCSMTRLEQELVGYGQLLRTHRSYIVNLRNIARTEGNARNYQLHFHDTDQIVPVSRNRFAEFNRALMQANAEGAKSHSSQVLPIRPKLVPVHNKGAV